MHIIRRLYREEFDFPATKNGKASYMLATTPRSGSTFFSTLLWRTGVAGAPMEYLNFVAVAADMMPRLGFDAHQVRTMTDDELSHYWKMVKEVRTSSNGVFSYKMFMMNISYLFNRHPKFLFEEISPDHVIYLTRQDILSQAISYARAIQTKVWYTDAGDAALASYEYGRIKRARDGLLAQHKFWEGYFLHTGIDPIRITYEDLLENASSTVESVLARMNLALEPRRQIAIPDFKRQRDDVTEEWRLRFQQDEIARTFTRSRLRARCSPAKTPQEC